MFCPQLTPLAEQGLPAYDVSLWFGMWAPAGTPPAVVRKLNAQVAQSMRNAEVVAQFGKLGISPLPMTQEEFTRFVRSEIAVYQRIRQAGRHSAAVAAKWVRGSAASRRPRACQPPFPQ